jgi:hypothetical protein
MPTKSLNLGVELHVDPDKQDTLRIHFHNRGTFCSPDKDHFDPPLPDGEFFKQGDRWPTNGEATPTAKNVTTRYSFHESEDPPTPSPCEQGTGGGDSGGPSTFNVIHIP